MNKPFVAFFACCVDVIAGVARAENNCTGATYYVADLDACVACPAGYDYNTDSGKTDIAQCQIHCDGGTFVETVGIAIPGNYTQLEYIESTGTQRMDTEFIPSSLTRTEIDLKFTSDTYKTSGGSSIFGTTGHTINFGSSASQAYSLFPWLCRYQVDSGCSPNSFNINGTLKTTRQTLILDAKNKFAKYGNVRKSITQNFTSTTISYGIALFGTRNTSYSRNDGLFVYAARIYEDDVPVRDMVPVRRNDDNVLGMYDLITKKFFTNSGTGEFVAGPDVDVLGGNCVNVGAGYYAEAATTNYGTVGARTACPGGTTTVGYGHGADSANDCGYILHVGEYVLYGRRNKSTDPSLNIKMPNDEIYYVSLSTSNHTLSRLHLSLGEQEYTAYDDSLYYGERDFDAGLPE